MMKKVSPSLNMKSDYSKKERQILDPNQNTTCVSLSAVFQSVALLIHLPLLWTSWQQRVTWKKTYMKNLLMEFIHEAVEKS